MAPVVLCLKVSYSRVTPLQFVTPKQQSPFLSTGHWTTSSPSSFLPRHQSYPPSVPPRLSVLNVSQFGPKGVEVTVFFRLSLLSATSVSVPKLSTGITTTQVETQTETGHQDLPFVMEPSSVPKSRNGEVNE